MSVYRATFLAIATSMTVGLSSSAFACCGDWGVVSAPVVYAGGCGGCGTSVVYGTPVAPAPIVVSGCGGCGVTYAAPVATWGGGCGGCGAYGVPSSLYVVNQGPVYDGPGVVIPYGTYTRAAAYAPAVYPYGSGWRHRYYGPRYASRWGYMHAHYAPGVRWRGVRRWR